MPQLGIEPFSFFDNSIYGFFNFQPAVFWMMNGGHQLYLAVVPAGPSSLSPVFCTAERQEDLCYLVWIVVSSD